MTFAAWEHTSGRIVVVAHDTFARHFGHLGMGTVRKAGRLVEVRRTGELFHHNVIRPGVGGMVHSNHLAARTTPEARIELRWDFACMAHQAIVSTLIRRLSECKAIGQ